MIDTVANQDLEPREWGFLTLLTFLSSPGGPPGPFPATSATEISMQSGQFQESQKFTSEQ